MASITIEGRGLTRRYPGVLAVEAADVTFRGGTITGLVGKNGAGKSTLIKMLSGSERPDEGEILVDGEPVTFAGPVDGRRAGISLVPQELSIVPDMSVAENVELGLGFPRNRLGLVAWSALRARTRKTLRRLGAEHIDPRAPLSRLSAVDQRLVMIARGLATDSRMLILDEPSASLTLGEIRELHRVLRALRDDGIAIVYVSHRLDEVESLTDAVVVMCDGRVTASVRTQDLDRRQLIAHITGGTAHEAQAVTAHRRATAGHAGEELLRVEGLSRAPVVAPATFAVRAGEVVGIAGMVGSGRTELLRLIVGADRADGGSVFLRGERRRIRSPRQAMDAGIVLLPEDRRDQGLLAALSIAQNVTIASLPEHRAMRGVPIPSRRRQRATATRAIADLRVRARGPEQVVSTLSGGNQQKIVIARMIEVGPEVFIFDEPTLGIDVHAKQEIYALIQRLVDRGKGVLIVSSEFAELAEVAHRVLVMREGELVAELQQDAITEPAMVASCYEVAAA
jgi:ABC-type sugar transport system ATPase subunit